MLELSKQIKKKYKDFNVTPQWLGKVLRDNNKTRKRTRHEHFPTTKYNKPVNKKTELTKFYKEIKKYPLNKIISIDETSISPAMIMEYSRCDSGKRCVIKTNDNGRRPGNDIHEMGGVRMGKNPKTSLLNAWNQMHECKNVFVTDGACMTSTSTQNPSLTFMAISARAANYAIRQMKKGLI